MSLDGGSSKHRAGRQHQHDQDEEHQPEQDLHGTRLSRAEAWGVSGCPTAAMSIAQSRSPSTWPYKRVAAVYSFAVVVRATTLVLRSTLPASARPV